MRQGPPHDEIAKEPITQIAQSSQEFKAFRVFKGDET